jgi:hypothetical protein
MLGRLVLGKVYPLWETQGDLYALIDGEVTRVSSLGPLLALLPTIYRQPVVSSPQTAPLYLALFHTFPI